MRAKTKSGISPQPEAARTDRNRFVALAFCWADVLLELDEDENVVFAAGPTRTLIGREPDDLVERPFSELVDSEDRGLARRLLGLAREHVRIENVSIRLRGAQGVTAPLSIAGFCLDDLDGHFFLALRTKTNLPAQTVDQPGAPEYGGESGLYDLNIRDLVGNDIDAFIAMGVDTHHLKVREFVADDIDDVIAMGVDMHRESIYHDLNYDPDKLRTLVEATLDKKTSIFCCFVAEHNDVIMGMIGGIISEHIFGSDKTANDLFLYVSKDFRGTRVGALAAVQLICQYEEWAVERGAKEVSIGRKSAVSATPASQFFRGLGYQQCGLLLKKRVGD